MPPDEARARCVAIIMDGNGRWATDRGLNVLEGHREGARALKQTVKDAVALGIEELTVYAFSTENWSRPDDEVSGLMEMFAELIVSETPELHEQGVRMRFVGRREGVSDRLREQMEWAERETGGDSRMTLFVAFNYGGRAEILDAAERYEGGGEEAFASLLYAPEMRDPELVIRTSGEERLSNFLLWQSAYAELFFTDQLWPDFNREMLEAALQEYASRARRFGARE
jgi:undecaprenyl diphosphate synthase